MGGLLIGSDPGVGRRPGIAGAHNDLSSGDVEDTPVPFEGAAGEQRLAGAG